MEGVIEYAFWAAICPLGCDHPVWAHFTDLSPWALLREHEPWPTWVGELELRRWQQWRPVRTAPAPTRWRGRPPDKRRSCPSSSPWAASASTGEFRVQTPTWVRSRFHDSHVPMYSEFLILAQNCFFLFLSFPVLMKHAHHSSIINL